jgi:hypothetical protein
LIARCLSLSFFDVLSSTYITQPYAPEPTGDYYDLILISTGT